MKPGYVKNTNYIPVNRDENGVIDRNQAIDLIREFSSNEEFYEIEPAIVDKVHLDVNASDFPKVDIDGEDVVDYSMIGSIRAILKYSNDGGQPIPRPVKPISPHIKQIPLEGEMVNIADYDGQLYYYHPVNLWGNVSSNFDDVKTDPNVLSELTKYNRAILPGPGDTIFQGRFGQSIHFGSEDKNNTKPNIKISVGQGFDTKLNTLKSADLRFPHLENINNEEACIWITTAEHVPLKTGSPSKDKTVKSNSSNENALHSHIILNSDSLIFNSKKSKISLFANTNFNVSARKEINLETPSGVINLLYPDAKNPAVKGRELSKFLEEIIRLFSKNLEQSQLILKSLIFDEEVEKEIKNNITNLKSDVQTLISKLKLDKEESIYPNFCSQRVFIGEDTEPVSDEEYESYNWERTVDDSDKTLEIEEIVK